MRCATSCFDATLYKKDLSRFWPLWILYTLFWLIVLPINLLSTYAYHAGSTVERWVGREPLSIVANGTGLFIAVCYGLLCAGAVWFFLYNNRSANLMHSLPARRETHFVTHTAAGITFFLLPHLIAFVTTLASELVCGHVHLGVLASALGCQTLMCLFFYAFATLCAMLTGHIIALPAFYAIFNFIVWLMSYLAEWLCTFFIFGYTNGVSDSLPVVLLTPIRLIAENVGRRQVYITDPATGLPMVDPVNGGYVSAGYYEVEGAGILAILAVVGLVMLGLALLLYRKRHMETAGDTVAVPFLRPVFLYCVGFCGSLAGGCVTYSALGMEGLLPLVFALGIWGVVFWFAGMMLLHKSFRVFKEGWWGCAVCVCLVFALCGALQVDLFGTERWVPNPNDIESVRVSAVQSVPYDRAQNMNAASKDPATIAAAVAAHQALVDDRQALQKTAAEYRQNRYVKPVDMQALEDDGLGKFSSFTVSYTMKNGRTMQRSYDYLWLDYEGLSDPASLESRLTFLINDRTLVGERLHIPELEQGTLLGVALEDPGTYSAVWLRNPDTKLNYAPPHYYVGEISEEYLRYLEEIGYTEEEIRSDPALMEKFLAGDVHVPTITAETAPGDIQAHLTTVDLTKTDAEAIRQAILYDFSAGNLGVRYLFDQDPARQDNTFLVDMEIMYETVEYEYYYEEGSVAAQTKPYSSQSSVKITLTPQATATIAALKAAGAFGESPLELRTNSGTLYQP